MAFTKKKKRKKKETVPQLAAADAKVAGAWLTRAHHVVRMRGL